MSTFKGMEQVWSARLGSLRNVVRQHVIADQLGDHLDGVTTVLDVGCGQGTQALRLASAGLSVTGIDPSTELLDQAREEARRRRLEVRWLTGTIESLDMVLDDQRFDLVCAHGLLMYLPDARDGLTRLAARTTKRGAVSFTVRNGDALAYRPGIRGDYTAALAAFTTTDYRNELGADARAHTLDTVTTWCADLGLTVRAWYGVRVLTDGLPATTMPDDVDLPACLAVEAQAGRRDPYRRLGSMLHLVAART